MKHSRYRYFDDVKWAEQFLTGELLFRSLSHYHRIEDGEVRGDSNEGSVSLKPAGGLVMHHERLGTLTLPDASFNSGVNTEEIFILCASASMTDELRIRFAAKACVEVRNVSALCARIQATLPATATFRAQRVKYYSPAEELGAKWAFPDMIAFSKLDGYAWQDEYRFCFSLTDALKYGKTSQQVKIPHQKPGTAIPAPPPIPRQYPLTIKPLGDICTLYRY